jgi:hypothetical protein
MTQTRIFVSYRREDTGEAVADIVGRLEKKQSRIFLDTDAIQVAERFPASIEKALSEAEVVLVFIGEKWLEVRGSDGNRRLDSPADFVRREVAYALRRAQDDCFVDILPVLVDGARMPSVSDLPPDMRSLIEHNGLRVQSYDPEESAETLSQKIDELMEEQSGRAGDELDELDSYLSGKGVDLGEAVSIDPSYAQDPDLHHLPHAAEWVCTVSHQMTLEFETFPDLYFEGTLREPEYAEIEGSWSLKPGPGKTLVLELSGRSTEGEPFQTAIPIQEKVGRRSYGGRDAQGHYFRLKVVARKDESAPRF